MDKSCRKRFWLFLALCLMLCLGLCISLCSCGQNRAGQTNGETGEFYSAGESGDGETIGEGPNGGGSRDAKSSPDNTNAENAEFTAFCDRVFRGELAAASALDLHYTLAQPSAYGIEAGTARLGSMKLEDRIADSAAQEALLTELTAFHRDSLSVSQQLIYDSLKETLEAALMGAGLELYEQPLAPTIGIQAQLPILLSEYSFGSQQDIEDYLSLLSQLDGYYKELLEFEAQKADAGLAPSDASLDRIIESCQSYLIDPEDNFLTESFETRLKELEQSSDASGSGTEGMRVLTETQKQEYRARHTAAIREHFLPAYEQLISGLEALKGRGIRDGGLSGLADGKRYYTYLLRSGAGLSLSPEELKSALSRQMEEDLQALSSLYAAEPDLGQKVQAAAFSLSEPQAILADLQAQMSADFPACPDADYVIRYVPEYLENSLSPAFYLTAPIDRLDQNVIYINRGSADATDNLYTTLAHEGFPGHLYQTVFSRKTASHPLLALLSSSGANEGWATYAENCACLFDNGLPEAVREYRARARSFSLCAHGLLDIGVNYEGWTQEEAANFIRTYFSVDDDTVSELWQTMIDTPTNYLEYCGGYVEILEMRREAEQTLGKRFSPLDFHRFLLELGPVPFPVIRTHFAKWLAAAGG